ncbi:hypothetical protein JJB09_09185 [Rhizobium sp. KVB221]|uniref:Lipoprotein n=1 Tax=Rhizobium setariae TaxID=2801340 RepID=A0A937CPU1_9HYPH|nr:hypothetical protein [Rhizobium setariae]MBL0372202.1 hypothetical protein [Rhizobium setariae]
MKTLPVLLSCLAAIAILLSSCVGGRTAADDEKHPDSWKRKESRYNSRHNGTQY